MCGTFARDAVSTAARFVGHSATPSSRPCPPSSACSHTQMASHDESSMSRLKAALLDEDIEARAAPSCGECEEAADSPVRPVRVTVCAVLVSALLAAAVFVCVRVELLSNFSASAAAGGFSTSTIAGAHHLASTISRQEVSESHAHWQSSVSSGSRAMLRPGAIRHPR